jgi:hypothetical protein
MSEEIQVRILFFAKARDLAGITNERLILKEKAQDLTGHRLLDILIEKHPK